MQPSRTHQEENKLAVDILHFCGWIPMYEAPTNKSFTSIFNFTFLGAETYWSKNKAMN